MAVFYPQEEVAESKLSLKRNGNKQAQDPQGQPLVSTAPRGENEVPLSASVRRDWGEQTRTTPVCREDPGPGLPF